MREKHSTVAHSIPGAFVFLLIAMFAVTSVTLTLIGTQVYHRVTHTAAQSSGAQVALSYLCNKVRTYDATGSIQLAQQNGTPVLCLYETIGDENYATMVYAWQGGIWERFAAADEPFQPENGERLADAQSLTFSLIAPDLMEATIVMPSGESRTLRMALRSGAAKEAT